VIVSGLTFGGWDLALNHSAAVLLDEGGDLVDFRYLTNLKGSADRDKARSTYFKSKAEDSDTRNMERLAANALWQRSVLRAWEPSFSYVEGYAFGTPKGEMTGEIAGAWKLQFWTARCPFRILDVASVKMFAAHNGNAGKDAMCQAVLERWGEDFGGLNKPWNGARQRKDKAGNLLWLDEEETEPHMTDPPKDLRQTEEDLCDAFSLARVCWTEWRIRSGLILPSDLEDDVERRVFLRTTKVHPVNILARPWTVRG
jgi:hypothetical protein